MCLDIFYLLIFIYQLLILVNRNIYYLKKYINENIVIIFRIYIYTLYCIPTHIRQHSLFSIKKRKGSSDSDVTIKPKKVCTTSQHTDDINRLLAKPMYLYVS